ncbi:6940_t:CDS:2, partial [Cetraspora pellucida]
PMTVNEIKAVLFDVLLGGVSALSSALCFIIYNVAKNPEILGKIHKEIEQVIGLDPDTEITHENLKKCHYLEALIKEAMRHT